MNELEKLNSLIERATVTGVPLTDDEPVDEKYAKEVDDAIDKACWDADFHKRLVSELTGETNPDSLQEGKLILNKWEIWHYPFQLEQPHGVVIYSHNANSISALMITTRKTHNNCVILDEADGLGIGAGDGFSL